MLRLWNELGSPQLSFQTASFAPPELAWQVSLGLLLLNACIILGVLWFALRMLQRQRQLRIQVAKLRIMTENESSCVFRINEKGILLDASAEVEDILGWKPEELVGREVKTIVHPEDLPKVSEDVALAISGKDVVVRRYRIRCKDGNYKWSETLSHYVPQVKDGRPREIVGIFHDISTRIATQQELAVKDSQLRLVQRGIRESEAKYRTLFNEMHAGFALYETILDADQRPIDFRVLEMNPAFEQLTDLSAEDAVGRLGSEVFADLDEDVRNDMIQVGMTGVANRFIHAFGSSGRYFDVSIFSPKHRQFAAVIIDVTEERRLEHELRAEQKKLVEAQRIAGLGYWHYNPAKDTISYEKETAKALRLAHSSDVEQSLSEFLVKIHPDDREYVETQFQAAVWQEEPFDLVFRVLVGKTQVRYINAVAKTYYDEHGKPLRVIGTAIDLTERMVAQNELRYQRELFVKLIENMPIGAYAKSHNRFILWNGAVECLTGKRRSEVIGRTDCGLFDEATQIDHERDNFEIMHGNSERIDRDETWNTTSGPKDVHLTKVPIVEENGRDIMVFGLVEDVSEKRRMEERLRQSQKMEAVGQLAGGIAHDFNNILQVILGYGELLRGHFEGGSESADDFNKILDAANRAMTLVTQLLTFSREEEGKRNRLDLNLLIADLVKMIERVIGEHIELSFVPKADLSPFVGDPIQIEQLLMNLCINARDAMPEGGLLQIATEEFTADANWKQLNPHVTSDDFIVISVSDNGVGMSKEIQNRIYEPFFTTKEVGKGTGLGLATVYAIVERHGGTIDLDSEPGAGTTFRVFFPRSAEPTKEAPSDDGGESNEVGGTETILLAEDEDTVRALSERTLRKAGYKVLTAKDGREAIEIFQSHVEEIDALVFDVVMPRRNGREAYEAIEKARPGVPVLFCSGCNDELLQWRPTPDRGAQILQKPYTRAMLLRNLRAVLSTPEPKCEDLEKEKSPARADLAGTTILLAEDSTSNRKLFRKSLHDAGAKVIEAANGQEAIDAAQRHSLDMILMDIQMPQVDGYTAASQIRMTGFNGPIVALTAHTRPREQKTCEEVGFTAVFGKPITYRELPGQVAEVLAEVRSQETDQ